MPADFVKIGRALISVSDKTGLVDLGKALAARGVEILSTGGTASGARRGGASGRRRLAGHRVSRNDGRAGEDAASAHPRRPARRPRRSVASGGADRQRHRPDRPADRQSLSVRGDARSAARPSRTGSRTSTSAARPWCAARPRTTRTWPSSSTSPTTTALLAELDRHDGGDEPRLPPPDGAESLRPDGGLRRGDLQLAGRGDRRGRPRNGAPSAAYCTLASARCAMARTRIRARALYLTAETAAGRRDRAAGPGQGTVLQQHQRHRRGLRTGRRVRPGRDRRGRDHQARQPLRRGRRGEPARGLREGARLRSGVGLRRRRGAEPAPRRRGGEEDRRDLHRGHHRPRGRRGGDRDRGVEEEPAADACRRPAGPARAERDGALGRGRPPGAGPRQRRARRGDAQGRHEARADRRRDGRPARSPGRSPST